MSLTFHAGRKNAEQHSTRENDEDLFDVAVDRETTTSTPQGGKSNRDDRNGSKRRKKDEKFGFGGKKRFAKSNDATSTADMRKFPGRRMKEGTRTSSGRPGRNGGPGAAKKGSATRLGKSRRAKARA